MSGPRLAHGYIKKLAVSPIVTAKNITHVGFMKSVVINNGYFLGMIIVVRQIVVGHALILRLVVHQINVVRGIFPVRDITGHIGLKSVGIMNGNVHNDEN